MGHIKYSVKFYLVKQIEKLADGTKIYTDKNCLVSARVSWNSQEIKLGCGIMTDSVFWRKDKHRFLINKKEDRDYCNNHDLQLKVRNDAETNNNSLIDFKRKIDAAFLRIEANNINPTKDNVKKEIELLLRPNKQLRKSNSEITLFEAFEIFIQDTKINKRTKEHDEKIKASTQKAYPTLRNHLKKFDETVSFEKLMKKDYIDKFKKYLRTEVKVNSLITGLTESTVNHQIINLKAFMNYAQKNNWIENDSYKEAIKSGRKIKNERTYFNLKELKTIYCYNPESEHLIKAKKCLIFLAFTGMRYGDFKKFNRVKINSDNQCYEYKQEKTGQDATAPISNFIKEHINHNDNLIWTTRSIEGKNVCISNQKLNDAFKELCQKAGINKQIVKYRFVFDGNSEEIVPKHELISCHILRHSFITFMERELEFEEKEVKVMSGHSSNNTDSYSNYIHINKYDVIKRVNEKLNILYDEFEKARLESLESKK